MQKKRNLPFQKWYWGDWFKAPDVQSQPPEIRCLWFEMIGRMHESKEYGVLLFNGVAPTDEEMAQVFGYGRDKGGVNRDVNRLVNAGVCTRRETDGAIVCRRMVKDEAKRVNDENNGKLGGNPHLGVNPPLNPPVTEGDKPSVKYDFCNMTSEPAKDKKELVIVASIVSEVIEYLNLKSGKNYGTKTEANRKPIRARYAEGKTLEDFKKVIDTKTDEWKNNSDMEKFLRPETLFGSKFESYLNQKKVEDTHERYERMHRENQAIIAAARNARVGQGRDNQIPVVCGVELAGSPDRQEGDFECPGME